jgi:HAD superfamily hydrolase (TIGR01509 family)
VKMAKPGADIFRLSLHALDREPHEVFFVDDSPRNVAAAEALGITSHLFTTPERFSDALHAAGFLS